MAREYTDTLNTGECTFQITGANDIALRVMGKYMMMLDNVASSMGGSDLLNMDGLINFLLDDALNRNIKEIVKRHGFANSSDFSRRSPTAKTARRSRLYARNAKTNGSFKCTSKSCRRFQSTICSRNCHSKILLRTSMSLAKLRVMNEIETHRIAI